jgi:sugar lactone lactonase YvrE
LAGTYNYSIPLTGGCGAVSATGSIVVTNSGTGNTAGAASSTPTLCNGTLLTNITRSTSGATGIGAATGLPAGVTANWAANVITISGTPTMSGTFNYSIPLTGGCGAVNATGTIVVNNSGAANTAGAASSSPSLCAGQVLTNITHATTNANGIGTASGLPAGLTATWAGNVITISGTPIGNGSLTYSIPLSGGCGTVSATGTITVISTQPFITSSMPITAVGTVSTFAGTSSGNLDGTGTAARFRYPIGVVADAVGNVYVTDGNNNNIRKITPSGVVTTLAGISGTTSARGYVDAAGAAARFDYPYGIAIDKFGTLFVADYGNNVIRKITPLGVVSTYAGTGAIGNTNGNALSATFNYPTGVATDAAGNVYVADAGNYVIRKITPSGIVSNVAGNGTAGISDGPAAAASFDCMDQMCSDASGNLYLCDGCSYIIRKITPSGVVSTIAGSGYYGYTDGVGTAASFDWMQGIAADAAGNVYVSDAGNQRIRRITPTGVVSTVAGSGAYAIVEGVGANAAFRYPAGLAFDPSGNLFVADQSSRRIRRIVIAETVGVCVGDPVVLTSNGGVSYTWAGPQAITNNASFNATVSGVFTTTVTNTGACTATESIFVGQPSQSWAGTSSNSWSTASNWAGGYLPDRYTRVTIPSGTTNSVSITANASAYDLTINSGATFTNGANNYSRSDLA